MSYLNSTGLPRLVLDLMNRLVPSLRKINGKPLSTDISLSATDIGYSNPALPDDNTVQKAVDSLKEKMPQPTINFINEVVAGITQGNFIYGVREGQYKIIDDQIIYDFHIQIINFLSSGAIGPLNISMPAPNIGSNKYTPIVIQATNSRAELIGYGITMTGRLVHVYNQGSNLESVNAQHITSDNILISGNLTYKYK